MSALGHYRTFFDVRFSLNDVYRRLSFKTSSPERTE